MIAHDMCTVLHCLPYFIIRNTTHTLRSQLQRRQDKRWILASPADPVTIYHAGQPSSQNIATAAKIQFQSSNHSEDAKTLFGVQICTRTEVTIFGNLASQVTAPKAPYIQL